MTIHIALIGRTKEPVLKGFQHYGSITKLYLLHSPNDSEFKFKDLAEDVRQRLRAIGFEATELQQIDPFGMENIINTIVQITENESPPFFLNITGGTNLMAGAACAAAFFVGAKAYYVLERRQHHDSEVLELPVPNIPYNRVIQKSQLAVLKCVQDLGGAANNIAIRDRLRIVPQKLGYHIRELEEKGLIVTARGVTPSSSQDHDNMTKIDKRKVVVSLTNAGRLVLSWSHP